MLTLAVQKPMLKFGKSVVFATLFKPMLKPHLGRPKPKPKPI